MPMLGDMLAAARNSSSSFLEWVERSDPALASDMNQAAEVHGLTPIGYVRTAVADFNRFASEEDWATLTSTMKTTDDPGTLCLLGMVHWRLTVRGCAEHSSNPRDAAPAEHRP